MRINGLIYQMMMTFTMGDIYVADCDKCLQPYWNEQNNTICNKCEKLDN